MVHEKNILSYSKCMKESSDLVFFTLTLFLNVKIVLIQIACSLFFCLLFFLVSLTEDIPCDDKSMYLPKFSLSLHSGINKCRNVMGILFYGKIILKEKILFGRLNKFFAV